MRFSEAATRRGSVVMIPCNVRGGRQKAVCIITYKNTKCVRGEPMTDRQAIDTHSDGLTRAEPREAGVNAALVETFLDDAAAAGLDIQGVMLHRAGRVVAEGWRWPYRADRPRIMHSATKSVMACAIGMAIQEGRFGLQDKVVSFFPELISGSIDAKLASMTV